MVCLVFLGGVVLGVILNRILIDFRTARGHFYIEPYDEDDTGFYRINISVTPNQDLINKNYIFLQKDTSQK